MTGETVPDEDERVIPFPFSRSGVARRADPPRDLGLTPLSQRVGGGGGQPKGHWCSRCQGIWWTHFGETECPVCGNRHG